MVPYDRGSSKLLDADPGASGAVDSSEVSPRLLSGESQPTIERFSRVRRVAIYRGDSLKQGPVAYPQAWRFPHPQRSRAYCRVSEPLSFVAAAPAGPLPSIPWLQYLRSSTLATVQCPSSAASVAPSVKSPSVSSFSSSLIAGNSLLSQITPSDRDSRTTRVWPASEARISETSSEREHLPAFDIRDPEP